METFVKEKVIYPSSDGKPMAENTKQRYYMTLIKDNLDVLYQNDLNVFIACDLLWYPVEGNPKICQAPDVMLAYDRPKGHRKSYIQHEENHLPPEVVFEILSDANTPTEMLKKHNFYNRYGVNEYYVYDPDANTLEVFIRQNEELEKINLLQLPFQSPQMQIQVSVEEGLVLYFPDGHKFEDVLEREARLEEAENMFKIELERAEAEFKRAETEFERAEAEREMKERLMQKLLELGIDPYTL